MPATAQTVKKELQIILACGYVLFSEVELLLEPAHINSCEVMVPMSVLLVDVDVGGCADAGAMSIKRNVVHKSVTVQHHSAGSTHQFQCDEPNCATANKTPLGHRDRDEHHCNVHLTISM